MVGKWCGGGGVGCGFRVAGWRNRARAADFKGSQKKIAADNLFL